MATLNIEGRRVQVDDSFLKLSPEDQDATVQDIASSLSAPVDPVGVNDLARSASTGVPIIGGLLNRANAASNAALAPVLNPLFDQKDQLSESTFAERYAHSLRDQEGADAKFSTQHPYVDTAAKLTGAIAAMIPTVGAAPGLFGTSGGLGNMVLRGGLSNAALGGTDAAIRGQDPLVAAGLGGAIGAGAPAAVAVAKSVASPLISNIMARLDPEGFARRQVARGIVESGRPTTDIAGDVTNAASEGQGVYNVADAMGNAGQRMLSTVARAPGAGRTAVVDAMNSRQADQGRRLASTFREGFDAPNSAEQTRAAMSDQANREASFNYAPVKSETQPIDVSDPVAIANRAISPAADRLAGTNGALPTDLAARAGIERQESVLSDPIASALKEARSYLAAPTLTSSNVRQAFRAKTNIDQMIARATDNKQGALVGELIPIRDSLDTALARTSSNYAGARDAYRTAQQRLDALDLGKELGSKPVRPEDAIRQFQALRTPEEQQAFRVGYADPYVRDVQNAAFGTDKSRPLSSDAVKQEINAFAAPGRADQVQRRIGRERAMFETRNQALGGSRTADNLADADALGVDPSVVGHVISGNWGAAAGHIVRAGVRGWTGNTPAVREAVAKILLQHGANVTPEALDTMVGETVRKIQYVHELARDLGSTATGAAAVTPSATKKPARRLGRVDPAIIAAAR